MNVENAVPSTPFLHAASYQQVVYVVHQIAYHQTRVAGNGSRAFPRSQIYRVVELEVSKRLFDLEYWIDGKEEILRFVS